MVSSISYFGGSGTDFPTDIAADHAGGAYIVGFTATQEWVSGGFDTTPVSSTRMRGYLAHLDSAGRVLWSSYTPFNTEAHLATDSNDNVILTQSDKVLRVSPSGEILWQTDLA